eukprot:TRINITY_DN16882_c0_g1_i1.p1 TRINITY_DN16882_c0_g1~~TRINITY_DN16882_c0_g1_i1.p1  ORF type:complete len:763 (+),score=215.42 TRINITY_DN16882_c0_g1_i1:123-2411(+)
MSKTVQCIDSKWENQRWYVIGGWTSKTLLGVDEPNMSETTTKIVQESDLPLDTWIVVKNETTGEHGWQYANSFQSFSSPSATQNKTDFVRRRQWVCRRLQEVANVVVERPVRIIPLASEANAKSENDDDADQAEQVNAQQVMANNKSAVLCHNKTHSTLFVNLYEAGANGLLVKQKRPGSFAELHFGDNCLIEGLIEEDAKAEPPHVIMAAQEAKLTDVLALSTLDDSGVCRVPFTSSDRVLYVVWNSSQTRLKCLTPFKWTMHRHSSFWLNQQHNSPMSRPQQRAYVANREQPCEEEREFVNRRMQYAFDSLSRFLDTPIVQNADEKSIDERDVPRIGFCYSGGGCRALISGLGFTKGAEKIGLYDSVLYSSGLSGGAWFQSVWFQREHTVDTEALHTQLRQNLTSEPFLMSPTTTKLVYDTYIRTCAFKPQNSTSLADLYGLMIAQQWFKQYGDNRLQKFLSLQDELMESSNRPLPIYNAVHPNPQLTGGYDWMEFSPFEVRSLDSSLAIPTWSFGRKFENGVSVNVCPEQCLGVLMGMWGSAFCASIEEMDRNVGHQARLLFTMVKALSSTRLVPPPLNYNWCYGMANSALSSQSTVELVDAGVCVNAPLPPLLWGPRHLDVVFVFDARPTDFDKHDSKDVLRRLELYAAAKGMKIPPITYLNVGVNTFTVFMDEKDLEAPVLVYMPLVKNDTYDSSFDPATASWADFTKFSYDPSRFDKLCGLTEANMIQNKDNIKALLLKIAARKRELRLQREANAE